MATPQNVEMTMVVGKAFAFSRARAGAVRLAIRVLPRLHKQPIQTELAACRQKREWQELADMEPRHAANV